MATQSKNVNYYEKLQFGKTYHILNRAIGNDKLFITEKDYFFFLQKLNRYLLPWVDVLAYCLIPNHFHLLIDIKEKNKVLNKLLDSKTKEPEKQLTQVFSNFFNSYATSFNIKHKRKGRLFLYPFKRIHVNDDSYLAYLISYIHRNPIHHGLTEDYSSWQYSSYNDFLSDNPTEIKREYILELFGSKEEFILFHEENRTKKGMKEYLFE